jgi:tellurite methyltransferase
MMSISKAMVRSLWRVLKPGGMLFARLGSSIGMENQIRHVAGRHYVSPDGSDRYLVDEALLMDLTHALGGELLDPIKTTVVQNLRSMTTWVLQKTR